MAAYGRWRVPEITIFDSPEYAKTLCFPLLFVSDPAFEFAEMVFEELDYTRPIHDKGEDA